MSDNPCHPYLLKKAGTFQWALRMSGKLLDRSDRAFDSGRKLERTARRPSSASSRPHIRRPVSYMERAGKGGRVCVSV
jgi:hypothetical protein